MYDFVARKELKVIIRKGRYRLTGVFLFAFYTLGKELFYKQKPYSLSQKNKKKETKIPIQLVIYIQLHIKERPNVTK